MINLNNNIVYYTIINKNELNSIFLSKTNQKLETQQSQYILKYMLQKLGIKMKKIYKTKLGKPYFKDQKIFFNYSHSNSYIACAISYYNVGIDIEDANRVINDNMIKACNLTQDQKLEELVKREAYCKLTGNGIAMIFDKNNFPKTDNQNITITNKNYVCSIYSDCPNPIFQFMNI